jgi:hypothetical protein
MIKQATDSDQQHIVDLVRRYLTHSQNNSLHIAVVENSVRQEGNWWHVPVHTDVEPRTYQYYDILADVETQIVENEHINVLLVPS